VVERGDGDTVFERRRRQVGSALGGREPQVEVPGARQAYAVVRPEAMVRTEARFLGADASGREKSEEAVRSSQTSPQAQAELVKRGPLQKDRTRLEQPSAGRHDLGEIEGPAPLLSSLASDHDYAVGARQETLDGCAEIPAWRTVTRPPWSGRVQRQQGESGPARRGLTEPVDDSHVGLPERQVECFLTRASDDDIDTERSEATGAHEGLVSHDANVVVGGNDSRPARRRGVGMPHERQSRPSRVELFRAGDGQRGLARATQRRTANRDDACVLPPGEGPLDSCPRGPCSREKVRAPSPRDSGLEPPRDRGSDVHASLHIQRYPARRTRLCSRAMMPFDPVALARWQLASDRAKTAPFKGLFERKLTRMSASPLAFLRGAAPLFYRLLSDRPRLAEGPVGEGWLTGDMHLENFGAYRPDPRSFESRKERRATRAVFDLNDFDDAVIGPFRFDVLRLTTSLILAGRELGANGLEVLSMCNALLEAYVRAAWGRPRALVDCGPVRALVEQVERRSRKTLVMDRTSVNGNERRFLRDPGPDRYRDLPKAVRAEVPRAFARYVASLAKEDRQKDEGSMKIVDAALRIAGTGSLGGLRVAVLVRGKGGRDGGFIFDLKEQGVPSAASLLGRPTLKPAERVVTAVRACLAHPPRMLGTTVLSGKSMFVRRLAPQEDKLELLHIDHDGNVEHTIRHEDLLPLASHLGALLGRAHRRGAIQKPSRPWSRADLDGILERAIAIAGVHEAVYLTICKLERGLLRR
jgi:uncharacterized protein (DUF2252 family)